MKSLTAVARFAKYVQFNTQSIPGMETEPSSAGQTELAELLITELKHLGIDEYQFTILEDSSFLVSIPASEGFEKATHVAFSAHMDTAPDASGYVSPMIHDYTGGDIVLPKNNTIIPASDLVDFVGKQIITSSGDSLLGGDDKGGIAAIMTLVEYLKDGNFDHGPITIWFGVDEEIGGLNFDLLPTKIVRSWDILWTVDGELVGPIDVGCFVCRFTNVTFHGQSFHPGVSGDKLKSAIYGAVKFASLLQANPSPMNTSGMESFHYFDNIKGDATKAVVKCKPRTFDMTESESMYKMIKALATNTAHEFGLTFEIEDNIICNNTRNAISQRPDLLQPGIAAHQEFKYNSGEADVRGGTDGAMINMKYPELPAPNMGYGGKNLHSCQEFVVVDQLIQTPFILLSMVKRYAKMNKK